MIANENDFIGFVIKYKNEKDVFKVKDIAQLSGMTYGQCLSFVQSLSERGIVKKIGLESVQINPIAYSVYESPKKKVAKSFIKLSILFMKFAITYVLGIISGLAIAYFTHKFGWQ